MGKLHLDNTAGFNAPGNNYFSKTFRLSDIVIDPDIASIFNISEKTLEEIIDKMMKFGYSKEEPVVIWKGHNILVDGRTRYTAAQKAGLEEIPVFEKEFENREAAILYTIERQVLRRNLTGAEILKVARMLPSERNRKGEGRAAEHLAKQVKVSPSTMYQAKKIAEEASPEVIKKVENGEISIKDGYKETIGKINSLPKKAPAIAISHDVPFKELESKVLTAHAKIGSACNFIENSENCEKDKSLALLKDAMECLKSVETILQNL